jgi:hypothetical protein
MVVDPYERCLYGCNHETIRGVLTADLLGGDGPYANHPNARYPRFIDGAFQSFGPPKDGGAGQILAALRSLTDD